MSLLAYVPIKLHATPLTAFDLRDSSAISTVYANSLLSSLVIVEVKRDAIMRVEDITTAKNNTGLKCNPYSEAIIMGIR